MAETELPLLPPYSGIDGQCPKCGMRCARAKWLPKPPKLAETRGLKLNVTSDPWYAGYYTGGDLIGAHRNAFINFAEPDWWPDEWLGRECTICGYRWDEQLAETGRDDA